MQGLWSPQTFRSEQDQSTAPCNTVFFLTLEVTEWETQTITELRRVKLKQE